MPKPLPTNEQLKAAMQRVVADFATGPKRNRDIRRVQVVTYGNSQPRIRVVATVPFAPPKFPGGVTVRLRDGSLYNLPIEWFYAVDRSDRQMWQGATPVTDRPSYLMPNSEHAPVLRSMENVPKNDVVEHQLIANTRLPQFSLPNFWSQPFHPSGTTCVNFYETFYYPYRFKVPADRMVLVNSVSYQFDNSINVFEQFEVDVLRETEVMAHWTDMMVPTASTNPAEQYAFSGHYRPIPVYCRVDHDQTLIVRVKVRGTYPYSHTDLDVLGGCFTVCLNGWEASLMDNRDGGARPNDMGDFNDMALGVMDGDRPDGEETIGGL